MSKGKAGETPGIWLKRAVKAQGSSFAEINRRKGYSTPSKYNEHSQNEGKLSFESLAELAELFPSMNMRYILTGEGDPLLPPR